MQKSDVLFREAASEDNDLKFMGLQKRAVRQKRLERFNDEFLPIIKKSENVLNLAVEENKITFDTAKYGKISFYPKANKVLIHKRSSWIKPGFKWLVKNILI